MLKGDFSINLGSVSKAETNFTSFHKIGYMAYSNDALIGQ